MGVSEAPPLIDQLLDPEVWRQVTEQVRNWFSDYLFTGQTLLELALIVSAAAIAWLFQRRLKDTFTALGQRYGAHQVLQRLWQMLQRQSFIITWLLVQLVVVVIAASIDLRHALLTLTTNLLIAWLVIKLVTLVVRNETLASAIAFFAWVIAALNIVGLLDPAISLLDDLQFTFGAITISALTVLQAIVTLGVLLWLVSLISQILEGRIKVSSMSPSVQVLTTKTLRFVLATAAFLAALSIVGVDLSALAIFGGAIGVGLGFGLQKIFANLVSGFIILMEKSIKPGDVIEVAGYYGRVDSLGARYVSVYTRDGIEHLIPNEDLIVNRVENWSYSQDLLRLRKLVGIHYKSDLHKARALCLEAADEIPRILKDPKPACLVKDFGESSVDLEMRFWINDPMNGRANVTSDLLTLIWDKFHDNGIEIPYPQRDLHLRSSDLS